MRHFTRIVRNCSNSAEGGPTKKQISKQAIQDSMCSCHEKTTPWCDLFACENALSQQECLQGKCRCEPHCTNQRFQRCQYSRIREADAGSKGRGVFANANIQKGAFVIEYVGEIISMAAAEKRFLDRSAQSGGVMSYVMGLPGGLALDASEKGNSSRFMNHSCDANCATQKWLVAGEHRIGIFATRNIPKGQELTYDYCFKHLGGAAVRCSCGAPQCRGFLGGLSSSAIEQSTCQVCGLGNDEENLLLCEACHRGAHHYCIGLEGIPTGQWYCSQARCQALQAQVRRATGSICQLAEQCNGAGATTAGDDSVPPPPGLIYDEEDNSRPQSVDHEGEHAMQEPLSAATIAGAEAASNEASQRHHLKHVNSSGVIAQADEGSHPDHKTDSVPPRASKRHRSNENGSVDNGDVDDKLRVQNSGLDSDMVDAKLGVSSGVNQDVGGRLQEDEGMGLVMAKMRQMHEQRQRMRQTRGVHEQRRQNLMQYIQHNAAQ